VNSFNLWERMKTETPNFADLAEAEYSRVSGMIPYEPGNVYLLNGVGTNYFKIGKTNNPSRRFKEIGTKLPFEVEAIHVWPTYFMSLAEKQIHQHHKEERLNGEWFDLPESRIYWLIDLLGCSEIKYAYVFYFQQQTLLQSSEEGLQPPATSENLAVTRSERLAAKEILREYRVARYQLQSISRGLPSIFELSLAGYSCHELSDIEEIFNAITIFQLSQHYEHSFEPRKIEEYIRNRIKPCFQQNDFSDWGGQNNG
jgi:hypothetical protein